jgi:transposase
MQGNGESQLSLTDSDARLMKQHEGFGVCYNTQPAIDAESHMIAGYEVTNTPTDHGQITKISFEVKSEYGIECLEVVADKDYEWPEDQSNALAAGIVPDVITRSGSHSVKVSFDYLETAITDEQKASSAPQDLKACLQAGIIPEIYSNILSQVEIKEKNTYTCSMNVADSQILKMTPWQMKVKAMTGYFIRDAKSNPVYCPQGNILRQKSIRRNGDIRYCNKLACKRCKDKCTVSEWKEADFNKDILINP